MTERDANKDMLIRAVTQMAEAGIDPEQPFTEEVFSPIAEEYGIASDAAYMSRLMLNMACVDVMLEAVRAAYLTPDVRKRLREVRKHTLALEKALGDLKIEDQYALHQADMATKLQKTAFGKVDSLENLSVPTLRHALPAVFEQALGDHRETLDLITSLKVDLSRIEDAFSVSLRMAGEGKKGRYREEHLDALFRAAFQILENFTEHRFTLQWHDDGQPISIAARFCTTIAEVLWSDAPLSLVQTSTRRVRETSIKISDLDEVPDYLDHFSKRSR